MGKARGDRSKMNAYQLAMSDFMLAFWDDPKRHSRITQAHRQSWAEYRREAQYVALRQALIDAAKAR